MSAGSMFGVLGALLTAAESALGAKVRVRVEQDLLPVYVAVSDAGGAPAGTGTRRWPQRSAAPRRAAAVVALGWRKPRLRVRGCAGACRLGGRARQGRRGCHVRGEACARGSR